MAFFITLAVVESDQCVIFEQLRKQFQIVRHEPAIDMQHVELGFLGYQLLKHLGAGALHHKSSAALQHCETRKERLGAGVKVASDQLHSLARKA